jgi:hypothetical protein
MTVHGRVKNGVVVFENGDVLPEGIFVQFSPLSIGTGDPLAVIAAMEAEPHLSAEDIAELNRAGSAGKEPAEAIEDKSFESYCRAEGDPNITLEEVRQALAVIPGSLTEACSAERDED